MKTALLLIYSSCLICFFSCNKQPIPNYNERSSYFENIASSYQSDSTITCVTFNIHLGFKGYKDPWNETVLGAGQDQVEAIAKILQNIDPDIIALQEVPRNRYNAEIGLFLEALASRLDMNYAFGANGYNDPYNIYPVYGEWGNAILTKYKIESIHNQEVEYVNKWERRSMIDVLLSVNDSTQVHALSLHHLPSPEGIPNTSTYIESLQEPVILMGDFNRVNQIIKLDNIGLIDVDSTYRMHRIDRILITDNKLKILNIGTIPDTTRTSDHPANYAVLKLQ